MSIQEVYQKAISYAATVHGEQKVPGKNYSYVVHLSEVAMEVMIALYNTGGTYNKETYSQELAVQCALLHDTIEDTEATYEDLLSYFGLDVANGVRALTKNKLLEKTEQMKDSIERIKKQPKEIWMVKMADRITNLQKPPEYWDKEKIISYRNEAVIICEELKDGDHFLATQLAKNIETYKRFIV